MLDFCYLVNPFYPPQRLMDEIKASFCKLMTEYPSGMTVNSLLAAKYFGLRREQIAVGNGAADLIKAFLDKHDGILGIVVPTFEEYPNRKTAGQIVEFRPQNNTYSYTADDLMRFFGAHRVDSLVLINPDNPSGNYIKRADVLRLAAWAQEKGIQLIVDESFVDFADEEADASLLNAEVLKACPSLVVVKSISKSFGVPGLRLGVIASDNTVLIAALKKDVAIWNINSFAEFFLQIFEKYKSDYQSSLVQLADARKSFINGLKGLQGIRVIPSQANFIMCELLCDKTANEVAQSLLYRYNIFIKDLSAKKGVQGEYIRLAVRCPKENEYLMQALKEIL